MEPGDLLQVVQRTRRVMSACDNAAVDLEALSAFGGEIADAAEKARRHLETQAIRLQTVLQLVETHPDYLKAKGIKVAP